MDFHSILSQLEFFQQQNPFKLREILKSNFPQSSITELSTLSESIHLSKRLKEKAFPYPFWNLSTHVFEQATDFRLAEFHSELLRPVSSHILDGCGGAGFDGFAFIKSGHKVTTTENDPIHVSNLEQNKSTFKIKDWEISNSSFLELNPNVFTAIYLDPMRRKDSGRFVELEDYEPSFSKIMNWLPPNLPVLIKVSPLLKITESLRKDFQLVFVGLNRECKEVLLARNFKNLSSENLFIWETGKIINLNQFNKNPELINMNLNTCEFIYEPHAALLKSRRQDDVSSSLNLRKPSEDCGYFFGNSVDVEHLYEHYQLIDKQYHKLSSLSEYLNNNPSFNFTFKKKNSSVDLEAYSRKIKWKKDRKELILFITEVNEKAVFWIGSKVSPEY